jgi:hypothetical protein
MRLDHPFHDQHATPCPLGADGQPAHGEALLRAFAGASPAWVDGLMALRNRMVGPLGLKTGPMAPAAADPARLVVGTGVRPHNLLGWAYLAVVWPAHWVISKVMVRRVAQALGGVTRSPLGS